MEHYMIGVSEKDVELLNLEEAWNIYKIARNDIDKLYNDTIVFLHHR